MGMKIAAGVLAVAAIVMVVIGMSALTPTAQYWLFGFAAVEILIAAVIMIRLYVFKGEAAQEGGNENPERVNNE
jgi:quinol-cytochrome oxidoreductase complex cytochrome b subunit